MVFSHRKMNQSARWIKCSPLVAAGLVAWLSLSLIANRTTAQEIKTEKYSDDVVAKAEKFLADSGLRRSGKSIQSTGTAEISRAITALAREKRELRLVAQEWKQVADRLAATRRELERLNAQYGELNLQLARVAGVDVSANNRIVGLLNATNAQMKALSSERERLKEELAAKRKALNDEEAAYAETVLAIRRDYKAARDALQQSLEEENVKIALKVMNANFDTPADVTADTILVALDKRIQKIEQEIFSESIKLESVGGSLYVDVVVGKKTARMVVDSGATMISLPVKTAAELGIVVSVDARELQLVLADGRTIPARGVTLPKVRIGQFEVENVEAAVLDAVAADAEPLLGMSFLGNFKFEIDPADNTLTLLRVETD